MYSGGSDLQIRGWGGRRGGAVPVSSGDKWGLGLKEIFLRPFVPRFGIKDHRGGGASPGSATDVYPFSDRNGAKTLPFGAAHTYIAYIRE